MNDFLTCVSKGKRIFLLLSLCFFIGHVNANSTLIDDLKSYAQELAKLFDVKYPPDNKEINLSFIPDISISNNEISAEYNFSIILSDLFFSAERNKHDVFLNTLYRYKQKRNYISENISDILYVILLEGELGFYNRLIDLGRKKIENTTDVETLEKSKFAFEELMVNRQDISFSHNIIRMSIIDKMGNYVLGKFIDAERFPDFKSTRIVNSDVTSELEKNNLDIRIRSEIDYINILFQKTAYLDNFPHLNIKAEIHGEMYPSLFRSVNSSLSAGIFFDRLGLTADITLEYDFYEQIINPHFTISFSPSNIYTNHKPNYQVPEMNYYLEELLFELSTIDNRLDLNKRKLDYYQSILVDSKSVTDLLLLVRYWNEYYYTLRKKYLLCINTLIESGRYD